VHKTLEGPGVLEGRGVRVTFDSRVRSVADGEASGAWIAPGFIDLQVNGFAGVDYNDPRAPREEIARSVRALHSTGVTRFYPTVITGAPHDMAAALANLARAKEDSRAIAGFHVEGPHISAEDGPRGAHPARWVRRPDIDEFRRWQDAARGAVRLVTLSPEWPEAPRYIEALAAEGVVVSIGHTNAAADQIADAVRAGATMSTHLGNGSHSIIRRHPNYIWDQLAEDRLTASFIVDGIHLPASFLKSAVRAKGVERSVLVTDASSPAGSAPGRYTLGEQPVDLTEDQRVVLAGTNKLAGSALRMDRAVANTMRMAGLTLAQAVAMATVNPARAGRVPERQSALESGAAADFTLLDRDGSVLSTYLDGVCVWPA
jgi:N-acetylglucosamine-6-phosphate deacetylase